MNQEINAIRMLSIDMIEKANSGHPGICMGAAPIMYSLYAQEMKVYSKNSNWFNRDRFVLSAGHGSAMLYSVLHMSGFDLSMADLKNFRQLNSNTPGHPELGDTDGVDSTSGPLGQGISQAVGLAMAEKHLAALYNKKDFNIIDHYTFVLCGDGDLQEGISSEASSLAGHLNLNKLIVLWDSNDVQLDDKTSNAISENTLDRYKSYGWNTDLIADGTDEKEITSAIERAKKSSKPTLIEVKTTIGYGSPNKGGCSDSHGAPLGEDEVNLVKKSYAWDFDKFEIPESAYQIFQKNTVTNGEKSYNDWVTLLNEYQKKFPNEYETLNDIINNKSFSINLLNFAEGTSEASRVSSGKAINNINNQIPNLIGGSADLSKSNNTTILNSNIFGIDGYENKNISYGVREFAMGSITNGLLLHGGLKAFCGTFFVFSDYLKPAIRMAAIQSLPSIFVMTHDSIGVGEDGPTHQPIEQLSGLRAIPNLNVIRPCDANETQFAWDIAIKSQKTPTILVLSRQNLTTVTSSEMLEANFNKGAYVLKDNDNYQKIIIANGSEVELALAVAEKLTLNNVPTRVISMPSMYMFEQQSDSYKKELFANISKDDIYYLEMATATEGYKYANNLINISTFGTSGKGNEVIENYGFTVDSVFNKINK